MFRSRNVSIKSLILTVCVQKKRFFYDEDPDEEEVVDDANGEEARSRKTAGSKLREAGWVAAALGALAVSSVAAKAEEANGQEILAFSAPKRKRGRI